MLNSTVFNFAGQIQILRFIYHKLDVQLATAFRWLHKKPRKYHCQLEERKGKFNENYSIQDEELIAEYELEAFA